MSYLLGWWGGRKCYQSIGDRQFVSFVQFFLHKCGEITLGQLHIRLSEDGNGPMVIVNKEGRELPLADVSMPQNVKNFESIRIRFVFTINFVLIKVLFRNYNESVLAFLQKFQQNSLLDNVNLCFYDCLNVLLQMMTLPLFTNINSIEINRSVVLDQLQSEYFELAIPMLASARILIAKLVFTTRLPYTYHFQL
jgi:hypothetical protein